MTSFKSFGFIFMFSILLSSCTTTGTRNTKGFESEYLGGSLKIKYAKNGEWESLESIASAPVIGDLPSSRKNAAKVATAEARAQIAEFLKTQIDSSLFLESTTLDIQKQASDDLTNDKKISSNITNNLKRELKQNSKLILKGTYLAEESYDDSSNTIKVIVRSSRTDMDVSKQILDSMK